MPSVAAVCLIPIALREEKVPSSRYTQARRARKGWMRAMVLGTMCSVYQLSYNVPLKRDTSISSIVELIQHCTSGRSIL